MLMSTLNLSGFSFVCLFVSFFFFLLCLCGDKESFLLWWSHIRGLQGPNGSSHAGTSRQADEDGTVIRFSPSPSVRGRLVAAFICWLTLCSATTLKTGIAVIRTPFTWRKFHSESSTSSGPLPHLCYTVATETSFFVCSSSTNWVPLLISIWNILLWRPVAAMPYLIVHASKGWKKTQRHYSTVQEPIMQTCYQGRFLDNSAPSVINENDRRPSNFSLQNK